MLFALLVAANLTFAQSAGTKPHQPTGTTEAQGDTQDGPAPKLPAPPSGRATVIGGQIHNLDTVRDQFTLKVFGGGQSMKILYDPRTQLYRDGVHAPLSSLRADERASVETTLDGTNVYALSIHTLSRTPEGECAGQVESYNSSLGALVVRCDLSSDPITLNVGLTTAITRVGQNQVATAASASDLTHGSLITAKFESGVNGTGVATSIAITAAPGAMFVFTGELAFFDLHSGRLVVVDPSKGSRYNISFDPALLPESQQLRSGARVSVTASFDGTHYVARAIRPE